MRNIIKYNNFHSKYYYITYFSFPITSSFEGKRPVAFFEKINFPSATTSNTPPPDFMYFGEIPNSSLIAAAKLEA